MVYTLDSLGYAKRLRERGVPQDHAEAHAEAARDFIMAELVTRADLAELATKSDLLAVKQDILVVKQDLHAVNQDLLAVKKDVLSVKQDLLATEQKLQTEFRTGLETLSLRLTVRLGAIMVVGIGALATILKLT